MAIYQIAKKTLLIVDKQFKFLNKVKQQVRVIHLESILITSYMVLSVIISDVTTKPIKINAQKTHQNASMCTRLRCAVVEKLGVRCK